jgi:hypothetical protein
VEKDAHQQMFPDDDVDSRVLSVNGRIITLAMSPTVKQ